MRIWRISNYADLSGLGGTIGPGRWHWKGTAIVYCADHPSTALLEILVHANRMTVPTTYQLIEIDIPDDITVINAVIPDGWEKNALATRDIGTAFARELEAPLLRVPSVSDQSPRLEYRPNGKDSMPSAIMRCRSDSGRKALSTKIVASVDGLYNTSSETL